jgi:hypothetical protein
MLNREKNMVRPRPFFGDFARALVLLGPCAPPKQAVALLDADR